MPDPLISQTGYTRAPRLQNGALVQLVEDIIAFVPNIVTFQYNPEINRALTPWNPAAVDQADRGSQAPTIQPFEVPEKFTGFELEFDATDGMGVNHPVYNQFGVEPQLAALRKMTQASRGLLGDLTASFKDLTGGLATTDAERPTVAPILLVLGKRIVLPVRITSYSQTETIMSPTLYPIMAKVSLELEVMTPDMFRCQTSKSAKIAVAAYEVTRLQEDAAAVLNLANLPSAISAVVPL
ncbi:MAG: hypothetical protein AAFP78_03385 [Pseudomonadota bacterium]